MKRILAVLLALVLVLQLAPAMTFAAETGDGKSPISRLDSILNQDMTQYYDGTTIYRLPDSIAEDDEISVIISLDVATVMDAYQSSAKTMSMAQYALYSEDAQQINSSIQNQKDTILTELDSKGVQYTVGKEYNTILSGFELKIQAADFVATCQSLTSGAQAIVSEKYEACEATVVENNVSIYEGTGIFDGSLSGYDGSGMVVAILDTGIDYNHTAFSTGNFTSKNLGLTYDDVAAVLGDTKASEAVAGLTAADVYISEKIPFGFDYADNDSDPYSTHSNHGTHVSGIIAGKDDTITGVAPNAQIVSMKVFSDVEDTAVTAWYLAALEDCILLDVDVINMSLGTACGFSRESDEEAVDKVYDRVKAAGISLVVAASNSYSSAYGSDANGNLGLTSNPDTGTVGSPSTYDAAMSVASIKGTKTPYIKFGDTMIYYDESANTSNEDRDFLAGVLGSESSKDMTYVVVPGAGRTADYSGLDVAGKIVLVRRGSTTFEEKAIVAQQQGAAAVIIYNNVSGEIKMNVGQVTIPVASITQDDGEMLAEAGGGTLTLSTAQVAGPFIDNFSSWGPTPDLGIKPEITAHGGNILSAVTGGTYDRMSGTSMAAPNMAGLVVLMRQYVKENFPDIANDHTKVATRVNQLLMSTADIALGQNGLPYAVRKQGSGLANLMSAMKTTGYVTTLDKNGNQMDKTKLELGDDPSKTGVYQMSFIINNTGSSELTYDIGAYVLTEGVSETKTNSGATTVTEEAYQLAGGLTVDSVTGGTLSGSKVTVSGGGAATVTVTITLTDGDKQYLDDSFENGMYVEGFITLTATAGTDIDLSIPYLAFYGDWTRAPQLDLDYFETDADEKDDSINVEDKTLASAYATRPIGGVYGDYICYLGSYYFTQKSSDRTITADREYVSLSNQEGTVHSLRYIWTGLLRSAARVDITITNDATGEVVFETTDTDVRKSYGDGASIYPASVKVGFDTMDFDLPNNTELTVTMKTYLDYGDGGESSNAKNEFTFPLTIDFEAPTVENVEYRYEYDKTEKKYRLYADVSIYDNHYAMSAQLGYITTTEDENGEETLDIATFDHYLTPVYSQRNSTTVVTYELTDYVYEIKQNATTGNSFVLTTYDYALNFATYEIQLPDDIESFSLGEVENGLTLSENEVYTLRPEVSPVTEWCEFLEISSSKQNVVRVVNDKLVAVGAGTAIIRVKNPNTGETKTFYVTVLGEGDEGYTSYDKPAVDKFGVKSYYTIKAYYQLNNEDRDIGATDSTNFFNGNYSLSMYPSESVGLQMEYDSYFPKDTEVIYESSNESIVKVSGGVVTAVAEGFASVTVKVTLDGKNTYYSETISVEVKDPFVTNGALLNHYFGNGGLVTVPSDLGIIQIGSFAFSNYEYVDKTEDDLSKDPNSEETTKQWYIGESTITKVVIPEGVETINSYAFANLTGLTEVVLPSTLEFIEYGAFYGCTSLEKISFSGENNLKVINQWAFQKCGLTGTLELPSAYLISDYAFAGNQDLEAVVTGDNLISIGSYAFAACKNLSDITITADRVKYGTYAFNGCKALKEFTVNSVVLPEGMFYECTEMTKVTLGADVSYIGEFAFRDTAISEIAVSSGNKTYAVQTDNYVLSADGKTLVAVAPTVSGTFTEANAGGKTITAVGNGAFSHNQNITAIELPNATEVGNYAFASNSLLASVKLGDVTKIGEYAYFETSITELPAFTADTEIGKYAFAFTKITSVTIPDNMVVAEGLFSECSKLTTVVVGNDVVLGDYAFGMNKDDCFSIKNYDSDGKKLFYYEFATALTDVTIGENVIIGERAFSFAASLEKVTLGANAKIGKMAFYNCAKLSQIDLSKAVEIGDYAFSGDVYNVCQDENMSSAAVSSDGYYIFSYFSPMMERIDLSGAEKVGSYAFSYCRDLTEVKLGEAITEIGEYTFVGCEKLTSINLDKVVTIGQFAFNEAGLESVDLSAAESVGEYAFMDIESLKSVTLNPEGTDLSEGAFANDKNLTSVANLNVAKKIGDWAFALTGLTKVDLSGAVSIGKQAFLKEEATDFTVVLGENLADLGDNPFAMCVLKPFSTVGTKQVNGHDVETVVVDYAISDNVKVVDGSLYCKVPNGWEMITYTGENAEDVQVIEDTVRVASMAFAGTDVQMVTLPNTLAAIGHKAFYACDELGTVVFCSYKLPVLEEEFDSTYFEVFEHIPGAGDYGTYTTYAGEEVQINGIGLIPYYMWNITDGLYSDVFYGATFVDYVGYVENKLLMVRPENGWGYDSFVMDQYFRLTVDGPTAPDSITMAAIKAIKAIPEKVTYEDRAIVEAAREAYSKIATVAQQALVTDYANLVSAEQRILALTPAVDDSTQEAPAGTVNAVLVIVIVVVAVCALAALAFVFRKQLKTFFANLFAGKAETVDGETPEIEEVNEETEETDEGDNYETEE